MVFLNMNSTDILEELRMFMMIMTNFVERLHEEAIEQRLHQATGLMQRKIIGTTDTKPIRNQDCCSRRTDMTRKIDVTLAHCQKLCSGNKDREAQFKL